MVVADEPYLYSEKYKTKSLNDLVGNVSNKHGLTEWANSWIHDRSPQVKALIFTGPPGTGKTAAAYALANDFSWHVILLDSSSSRNKEVIEKLILKSDEYGTFTDNGSFLSYSKGSRKLILIDEADVWFERESSDEKEKKSSIDTSLIFFKLKKILSNYGIDEVLIEQEKKKFLLTAGSGKKSLAKKAVKAVLKTLQFKGDSEKIFSAVYSEEVESDVFDRSGVPAIIELIKQSRQPIILTVNDMSVLRKKSQFFYAYRNKSIREVPFWYLNDIDVHTILKRVKNSEKLHVTDECLREIAERCGGDVRAALNDLQAIDSTSTLDGMGKRDLSISVDDFIEDIFANNNVKEIYKEYADIDLPPDRLIYWLDENIGKIFKNPDLYSAIDYLAKSDVYLARARTTRSYGLWKYAIDMMIIGTVLSHKNKTYTIKNVSFPLILKRYKDYNMGYRLEIYKMLSKYNHLSMEKVKNELFDHIVYLYKNNKEFRVNFTINTGLERDMVAILLGVDSENSVVDTVYKECDEYLDRTVVLKDNKQISEDKTANINKNPKQLDLSNFG